MVVKMDDPQDMDSTPLEINVREQLDKEKYEIFNYNQQKPMKGDNWYLVERHWFEQWKKYVEKNGTNTSDAINKNLHPGRIDNSNLLLHKDKSRLKSDLLERSHYELLPQPGWEMLVKLYGIVSSNHIIERQSHKEGEVEVYPIILNLKKYGEKAEPIEESFSKLTLIADVKKAAKQILEVPENKKTKLWDASQSDKMCKLDQKKTVSDCFLQSGQLVILEVADDDGNWPYTSTLPVSQDSRFRNSYLLRNGSSSSTTSYMTTPPGQCGLSNLGNTCFMNSALQCLSNVQPLTNYFLSNKHHKEINRENPLGNGGKLAEDYASLIQVLWSGQHTSTSPREFKYSVSQFAPRFSGYQQHDSQELMSFLVDGLHEDLNRISKKPYIEMKEAGDRPMTEVAEESWQNHRKRNDSIIVDTLHGLFRSTVDCPECPRISVTFDPFCFLSLPLPAKRERHVECLFVPLDMTQDITKYKVTVNKFGSLHDLHQAVGLVTDKSPERMSVVQIFNSKFQTFYKKTDLMKQIYEKEQLYVFESDPGKSMMPLYMRKGQNSYNPNVLSSPLLVPLSTDGAISYVLLYRAVYRTFYRHLTNTELKNKVKQFIESTSEDMEDFVPENKEDSDENSDDKEANADDGVDQINLFDMFQMKTVNAYGTSQFKVFKHGEDVEIDENSYLCADWDYDLYKKYIDDQWNNKEKLHPSADPLAPKKTTKLKLQDCMKLFTTKEQLDKDDAWYCSSCKKHQQATKKFDIWMLPPVLIIHLKRFSYTRFTREKLDTYVDFPLKNLDLTDFVVNPLKKNWPRNKRNYNLIAVSNHFGGLGGGHYTAFAKNDGSWHYFDDSSVSSSNQERVVSKAAYMLVYQRQDLEEWYDDSDNKFRNFPYLQPLFSPRAFLNPTMSSQTYSNGGGSGAAGNNRGTTSSDDDDDVFNNNHDEAMDTTTT